ncbi:hypothetical protein QNO07_25565 [Streptomyces sp. 549]|uniref:hypothetical protein n=1 Tax=Streptomyces sp. 549 TaxID=3049076 RepID=UPI0024C23339|nr:hypothetical protein [Streptomyces sp. 549]MDK1476729.1 hypothetical protein [Streptomyces sp. 549]
MSRSVVGLMVGMALGFAGWFGGLAAFLLVGALGALGWLAGRAADSDTEPAQWLRSFARSRQ